MRMAGQGCFKLSGPRDVPARSGPAELLRRWLSALTGVIPRFKPGRLAVRPKACGSTHSRLSLNLTALAGGVSLVLEMAEISSLERLCAFYITGNRFAARFWLVC